MHTGNLYTTQVSFRNPLGMVFATLVLRGSKPCNKKHVQIGQFVCQEAFFCCFCCNASSIAMKHVAKFMYWGCIQRFATCLANLSLNPLQMSSQECVSGFLRGCICNACCCKAQILLIAPQNYEKPRQIRNFARCSACKACALQNELCKIISPP